MEIIGAGMGRTGTLSLKSALETLGFGPCHHMTEILNDPSQIPRWRRVAAGGPIDWDTVLDGYRSVVDWPGARFWRELAERYPKAGVILTEREPERWYESVHDSIYQAATGPVPDDAPAGVHDLRQMSREIIWDGEFGGRFCDRSHAIETYIRHNQEVRREIPAERLLVYTPGQDWAPLCEFLNVPVPDQPFPHLNDRAAFHAMMEERNKAP